MGESDRQNGEETRGRRKKVGKRQERQQREPCFLYSHLMGIDSALRKTPMEFVYWLLNITTMRILVIYKANRLSDI